MTVTVGGPPAGARTVAAVRVLRGTSAADWTPAFPGRSRQMSKATDQDGLHRAVRPHTLSANRAARLALALYLEARRDDRAVHVLAQHGADVAHVYDGRGRLVEDLAPGPTDEPTARVLARAECFRLRELVDAQPWRWEIVPWKRPRPADTAPPRQRPATDPSPPPAPPASPPEPAQLQLADTRS